MNKIDKYVKHSLKMMVMGMCSTMLLLYLVTLDNITPLHVTYLMSLFWAAMGAGDAYASYN